MKPWLKYGIIFFISAILIIGGLTVGILWPSIYTTLVNNELSLTNTSTNYELWKETPIPMYLKFYMFNWTNVDNFTKTNAEKPNFVEMGPYVFREVDYKVNEVWNTNGTITFQRRKVWHFDQFLSNGSLSDEITNLNPVATSVMYSLRTTKPFFRDVADRVMRALGEKIYITKTVSDLLFDGYNDTMLLIARKMNLTDIPYDKFGWFYGRNGSDSYDGTFTMDTGASSLYNLGMVREWNFKSHVDYYDGECGNVRGSMGDLWPPLLNNESVSIFIPDICRSLDLTYDDEMTHGGLIGRKYIADYRMLDNGTRVPSHNCSHTDSYNLPSGMLDVSMCKYNAPAFISLPHFYLADPSYGDAITGMNPDKKVHEMSLSVQPDTGVPLSVQAKLQLNLLIEPDSEMSLFKDVNKTFIPMLWFSQEAELTSKYSGDVKFLVILRSLGSVSFFGIAAIGFLILFIGIFLIIRNNWRGEENQVLLSRSYNYGENVISG